MGHEVNKSFQEINEKIRQGKAVVVTAEEMIGIVRRSGKAEAARKVDVVTTGTFSPMCSSGLFLNFGHSKPGIKASRVWFNDVPACAGLAAVDVFLGATEPAENDPLNKVYPGEFKYGGGHVIAGLLAGERIRLRAEAYGTDCYPRKKLERDITLEDIPYALLCNPRNAYQNYPAAVNLGPRTIYTYMGTLRPRAGNINYATAGQLSPLLNDPFYLTIGLGTRIFLGGGVGYVTWHGTQHNPDAPRGENGVPRKAAGALMVTGDLKGMNPRYIVGVSMQGYGCSLAVGIGVPIPILNEDIAGYCGVSDEEIFTQVLDYSSDYPSGNAKSLAEYSYAQLRGGTVIFRDQEVPTAPLSSYKLAREIAEELKTWIEAGKFLLGEPQQPLPRGRQAPW
ncbi:MAG: homocysteine biosynthesis protein [Pseudomonadota bacterium]